MDIYKQIEIAAKGLIAPQIKRARKLTASDVQEDFNNELVDELVSRTGRTHGPDACFVKLVLEGDGSISVKQYVEPAFVSGVKVSNSSYHPGHEGWRRVMKFKSMSKDEFWEMRNEGKDDDHGTYGGIGNKWFVNNFWEGLDYITNGWPLGEAQYLSGGYVKSEAKAGKVAVQEYVDDYMAQLRYHKHFLNRLLEYRN